MCVLTVSLHRLIEKLIARVLPSQDEFMIQCDSCDEWYHGVCVDIKE